MMASLIRCALPILLSAVLCACTDDENDRDVDAGVQGGDSGMVMDAASDSGRDAGDATSGCPADPLYPYPDLIPGCPCPYPNEHFCCNGLIVCTESGVFGPLITDDESACDHQEDDSGVDPYYLECV